MASLVRAILMTVGVSALLGQFRRMLQTPDRPPAAADDRVNHEGPVRPNFEDVTSDDEEAVADAQEMRRRTLLAPVGTASFAMILLWSAGNLGTNSRGASILEPFRKAVNSQVIETETAPQLVFGLLTLGLSVPLVSTFGGSGTDLRGRIASTHSYTLDVIGRGTTVVAAIGCWMLGAFSGADGNYAAAALASGAAILLTLLNLLYGSTVQSLRLSLSQARVRLAKIKDDELGAVVAERLKTKTVGDFEKPYFRMAAWSVGCGAIGVTVGVAILAVSGTKGLNLLAAAIYLSLALFIAIGSLAHVVITDGLTKVVDPSWIRWFGLGFVVPSWLLAGLVAYVATDDAPLLARSVAVVPLLFAALWWRTSARRGRIRQAHERSIAREVGRLRKNIRDNHVRIQSEAR